MHKSISPGQRFIAVANQTRGAVLKAVEFHEERGLYVGQAIHLLRNDVMLTARTAMGPRVADRLAALCEYMCTRLVYADVHNVDAPFYEVIRLLDDLKRASPSLDQTRAVATLATREGP